MKTATSIISWLGGIVTTIEGFVYLSQTGKSYISENYLLFFGLYL